MSTATQVQVPEFDLADRMRKALRHADIGVSEMAEYMHVHRNTVSAYIGGRIHPDHRTLLVWAERTGVPVLWLEHGIEGTGGPGGGLPTVPKGVTGSTATVRHLSLAA